MRAVRRAPERSPRWTSAPRAHLLALALAVFAAAVVPVAFPADRDTEQRDADARQTLYVRRALGKNDRLAPHTAELWVEVRGTTATLSGMLPSAVLKQLAVHLAGEVAGIDGVRADELQVAAPHGIPDVPSPFVEGLPPRGSLAGNPKDGRATREPKKADLPNAAPTAAPSSVTLGPPVPISVPAPAPSGGAGALIEMLPPRPITQQADLPSAVEALRRKEDRFRRLKVEVRGKTVYLSGTVSRWADAGDLANGVRRLPGVEGVIEDNIQVDRSGAR